ncbi:MAG: alpha/beta hydrolase [Alphaproteobacteria bacterium HGW-Alphaproteobacteria-11]|nr:MAG: alpha/beta hydrolase [Alphaproteobacteria bacterium HGW-Alphaproteobacteria-11]
MTTRVLDSDASLAAPRRIVPGLSWRGRIFNLLFGLAGRIFAPSQPPAVADFDFETARRRLHRTENLMTSAPAGMQVEPASGAPVAADWVVMPESQADRVLVFVHSGSFIFGQSRLFQSLAARICKQAHAKALSVDYRLAPESPFPAAISDVAAAYEWLLAEGAEPAQIQFVGDSAGGGIALGALLLLRERGIPMPAGLVLLAPWADMTLSGRSVLTNARKATLANNIEIMMVCRELYLQGHAPGDPLASPVFADLEGLPPALIQASTVDILLDDAVRIDEALRRAGIDSELSLHPPMPHGWQRLGTLLPESRRAIEEIGDFIARRFGDDAGPGARRAETLHV